MKKRTIYIGLFLIFIIGVISLIGTFAIDTTITEGNSSKADYLFNIVLGDRTNRDILIPSYDSKIVDIKISNPNEFNMSYLLYLEGVNSNISIINISDTDTSGVLNSKNTNLVKVFIQNNSSTDTTVSIKDIVGFEKEILELPSNSTSINKDAYYKTIVKSNNNTYGKVKPNIKLSTKNGTVKYNIVPNDGYQYKSTTCDGTIVDNILTISNITSNVNCEVVFEPKNITVTYNYRNNIYNQDTSTWNYNAKSYVDNNYSYNGTTAVHVVASDTAYTGVTIPLNSDKKQNTNYILSVKAYRVIDFSGNLRVYSATFDSSGNILNYNHAINITTSNSTLNTWKEYSYSFNSLNYTGWELIYIDYDTVNQGSAYVSDIRLDEYENKNVQYGDKYGTMPTPTRSGYTFAGWYTEPDGGGTKVDESTVLTNTSNHTLYAKWDKMVKVSFDVSGGNYNVVSTFTDVKESTYTVPHTGTYKLETWGAQGGTTIDGTGGGYGGYSTGTVSLNSGDILYVNVGGQGSRTSSGTLENIAGGYNGGGLAIGQACCNRSFGSGGGATHIATKSGLLSSLSSNLSDILIVSGGGGGAYYGENVGTYGLRGGSGGGYIGNSGAESTETDNQWCAGLGGTQTAGGAISTNCSKSSDTAGGTITGSFGQGGGNNFATTGGGGGFYGGSRSGHIAPGGGGSGYIGNSKLSNKYMYCFICATSDATSTKTYSTTNISGNPVSNYVKTGNGAARIILTSINRTVQQSQKYGTMPTPTKAGYSFGGWYTGENGTGTRVTSDTIVSNASDHTLYAKWTLSDTTKPTCTLSASGTTISATYSDEGGSGLAYYGWSSSYSGSNSSTGTITGAKTYTFYVKDGAGNTNTCSGTVANTTASSYEDCGSYLEDSGGCYYYNSATPNYVASGSCRCANGGSSYTVAGTCVASGSSARCYCSNGSVKTNNCSSSISGYSCSSGYLVNKSCKIYTSGTTVTTYSCASGYTKLNDSYCWQ